MTTTADNLCGGSSSALFAQSNHHKTTTKKKGIQVICAGLGRTGTLSLTEALQILGYKPYHFVEFRHASKWAAFSRGEIGSDTIIDTIVDDEEGYDAVLENPCSDIYQDILERYPNAKVVLTVRDNRQQFEDSWKTLFDTMIITEQTFRWNFPSFFGWIPLFRHLREIRQFMGTTHLGLERGALTHGWREKPDKNRWLADQYEKHNHHVCSNVPVKQLLVFNVKDGWEPLCDFLGCEIPKDGEQALAFPHSTTNDTKALKQLKRDFLFAVYGWIPLVVVSAVSVGTAAALWYGRKR